MSASRRLVMTKDGSFKRSVSAQSSTPLPVLLAHVLLDINREFERAGAAAGEQPSLLVLANVLRVIPDDGISLTDLPAAARISRRAMRTWLRLEKRGWLDISTPAPGVKTVKLTDTSRQTRDRWGDLLATTEREWSAKLRGARALRGALEALVGRLVLELPHYPMTYGTADPSAIGGGAVPAREGPPRIPAHGTDWVAVVRTDAGNAKGLPLSALLSQALMAFTIDFEEEARFSMAVAAILRRAMPTRSVPLGTLPPVLGVDGSGKSGLERHGVVRVTGKGGDRVASLTRVGAWICDSYERIAAGVAGTWLDIYGDAVTSSLAKIDEQLTPDLPDYVLVRYVAGGFTDVSFTSAR
jgi:hypothetical protein